MPNNIETAVRYFNNDAELEKIYQSTSYTGDWIKPNVAVGAKTVKYRQTSFATNTLGTFDRDTGYTKKDINTTWVEKTLTQDKGDSLVLDKMDGEEAQFLEIGTVGNSYIKKVQIPAVDTYRFDAVVKTSGVKTMTEALTAENIEASLDTAIDYLATENATIDVIVHIAISKARLLKQALKKSGNLPLGQFNGDATIPVYYYGDTVRVKIVEVPDAILGTNVDFIMAPKAAVAAMVKYQENEYFDKIPGFGARRAQLDIGVYHDCWVEPGAEKAVYVHKAA